MTEAVMFTNHYDCPCGNTWSDRWAAMSDDDCSECGLTCSPTDSEEED